VLLSPEKQTDNNTSKVTVAIVYWTGGTDNRELTVDWLIYEKSPRHES